LPSGSGGGGGSVTFPITIAQGGTSALDAASARSNLGVPSLTQLANYLLIADLPAYPTLASLGGASISQLNNYLLIANLPAYPTLASLGAVATSTYTAGLALKLDASARSTANGVAPLDANSLVPIANLPLNTFFSFTAGASFKGGGSPGLATNIQAGIDGSGLPRYWLVNESAPVNSRIKSITVANNGNVQIRHHNDNLSDGNVLEHTASGNVLTNGTLRCGAGSNHFTGAQFVPGALFFRNDINMLIYSDGTNWRRMDNNAIV